MTARPAPSERRAREAEALAPDHPSRTRHFAAVVLGDWWGVGLLGALTIYVFTRVGDLVFEHGSTAVDANVRAWMVTHQAPAAVRVFTWITTFGAPRAMYAAALLAGGFFWWRGHRRVAIRCIAVPLVAMAMYESAKRIYARARPPGLGGVPEQAFSFPSAHATASAAVCGTVAYVLWREGFVGRTSAVVIAFAIPGLIGMSRLYLDRHWATDVLGGWSAGYLIAALSAALYNRGRRRRKARIGATMSPSAPR